MSGYIGGSARPIALYDSYTRDEIDAVVNDINADIDENAPHPETVYVVESGSSVNGTYVRYSDGTQHCFHKADFDTTGDYTSDTRLTYRWNYPAEFVGDVFTEMTMPMYDSAAFNNITGGQGGRLAVRSWGGRYISYTTHSDFTAFFETGSVNTSTAVLLGVSLTAIGRWK